LEKDPGEMSGGKGLERCPFVPVPNRLNEAQVVAVALPFVL